MWGFVNMGKIKKILIGFLIISIIGTAFVYICFGDSYKTVYPEHSSLFYIEDYSGVYTAQTEQYIMDEAVKLQSATKAQVVVVSVPDTHEDSLEHYSVELANRWGIGDKEKDNGVLILFTTNEPHVRLEVGKGLEGCLPDGKAGRILDEYAVDAKDNGRWNEAAVNTFAAVVSVIYEEYGLQIPESVHYSGDISEKPQESTMADMDFPAEKKVENEDPWYVTLAASFVVFWLFALIPLIVVIALLFGGRGSGGSSGRYYGGSGGFSGGSGGFSGGGGSFGGGGASR